MGQADLLEQRGDLRQRAHIIRNGADWFAQMGTEKSKGSKVFCLTGKINKTGLAEVPMESP